MSIQIDTVRICGFRGICNIEISLSRVNVLLGQNNAGKTSIIKAMQLALGDYVRYLSDEDFYIGKDEKRQESITIDLRFIAIKDGIRTSDFSDKWQLVFKEGIQNEAEGKQFVVIRTLVMDDIVKGGYKIDRCYLNAWPPSKEWQNASFNNKKRLQKRLEFIPFVSIDAQRDVYSELRDKSSYIGRVLSSIKYNEADTRDLECMMSRINKDTVEKSEQLIILRNYLNKLDQSFTDGGQTELTPFSKKLRDLSKGFSVNYGESEQSSFSMEYHGMGTRSWASMLAVKAFIELLAKGHKSEEEPFFPIIAAEEPEAHLHPNAQRTLYKQLIDSPGQVVISTHSPYIAGLAEPHEIKYLKRLNNSVQVYQLRSSFVGDDLRKLKREVIHSKGEVLFSKAIVLCEGETEEQVLPALFEAFIGRHPFELGINFIAVNGCGAKYRPFLILAKDFDIPVYVFSDGEDRTVNELKESYNDVFGSTDVLAAKNITILNGTNFEGYLLEEGFMDLIEQTICEIEGKGAIEKKIIVSDGSQSKRVKTNNPPCATCGQDIYESKSRNSDDKDVRRRAILDIMGKKKPQYAKAVVDKLLELSKEEFPRKIVELFKQIKFGESI